MDVATTRSVCNDNLTSTLSSSNNAAAATTESTVDRVQRHRARYGFGFKPPQAKPSSRSSRPTMPTATGAVVSAAGDEAMERPSVNGGDTGHMANGDGRAPTSTLVAPPCAKRRQRDTSDIQRQTTAGDRTTKQSGVRRPAQKSGSTAIGQRQPVSKATASNGVTQASDDSVQIINGGGGHGRAPPPHGRRKPADKSVKLLVNYRSNNDRHAPLQSAYGNRDFFGSASNATSSSASAGAAGDAVTAGCAVELPQSGNEDMKQPRSAYSNCYLLLIFNVVAVSVSGTVTRWSP